MQEQPRWNNSQKILKKTACLQQTAKDMKKDVKNAWEFVNEKAATIVAAFVW